MKVAVVGSGVSGLVAAALLHGRDGREHEVTLFERSAHLGGHAQTVRVEHGGASIPVDTGFMVFNEVTYPSFTRLLSRLEVASRPSEMSFSVCNERHGIEYCGSSLGTVFAQPGNLVRPAFLRMLVEILRFNRRAPELARSRPEMTLGELLATGGFGTFFRDNYLVPMTAAIWSAAPGQVLEMPASFLVRFLENHGLLTVDDHHPWRTVEGGSVRYVEELSRRFRHRVRLKAPVEAIERVGFGTGAGSGRAGGVRVVSEGGEAELFDEVVLAVHADQALRMLSEPTAAERRVLGAFPYQRNTGVLHTDRGLLPKARRARASWNYSVPDRGPRGVERPALVTYDLSRLQGLPGPPWAEPLLLTINGADRVDHRQVIRSFTWSHPIYTLDGVTAQGRHGAVSGVDRVHYCGAYWGNGFHEDGVASALAVAGAFGRTLDDLPAPEPRPWGRQGGEVSQPRAVRTRELGSERSRVALGGG